ALVRRVRLGGRRRVWQVERAGGGKARGRRNLQVSGGGAQATMAKEQLNSAQIGARFEEVNREGMAQRMRADGFGDAATTVRLSAGMLNGVRGDRSAEIPGEEPLLRPRNPPIVTQRVEQFRREHEEGVLGPFPVAPPATPPVV